MENGERTKATPRRSYQQNLCVDIQMGKLSSHRHGVWTYEKTRPARHSKKPTLVEGVHDHLGDQLYG